MKEVWQSRVCTRSSECALDWRPASTLSGTAYERDSAPWVRNPRVSGVGPFDPRSFDVIAWCFVRVWSTGRSQVGPGMSREGFPTETAGACAASREGSVCITRQCPVVSKRNRKSTSHLAPCPTGLRFAVDLYLASKVTSASNPGYKPTIAGYA